jgi:hypothetical protein
VSRYPKYTPWAKKVQRTPKPKEDPLAPEKPSATTTAAAAAGGAGGDSTQALVAAIRNKKKVRG